MGERVRPAAWDRPLPRVLRAIVLDALRLGIGAALPTNAHYLGTVGATAGTIQRAVAVLAEQEALTTTSHGAAGRQIGSLHVGRAWTLAGLAPVRLLLPPSGPVEIDALVDRITDRLDRARPPSHREAPARRFPPARRRGRGRRGRRGGVVGGARRAADRLGEVPIRQLGPGTFYAAGAVVSVVRAADPRRGPPASPSIATPPTTHCSPRPHTRPMRATSTSSVPLPEVPAAVLRGDVDAGVWHRSPSVVPRPGRARLHPLRPRRHAGVGRDLRRRPGRRARERPELRAVLDAVAFDRGQASPETPSTAAPSVSSIRALALSSDSRVMAAAAPPSRSSAASTIRGWNVQSVPSDDPVHAEHRGSCRGGTAATGRGSSPEARGCLLRSRGS